MKVILKNRHPPAAGESPGGLPPPLKRGGSTPPTIAGPDAALSQISNLFQISCSPPPGTRALPHRKPNIKYQERSGGKWGARYFQYLNSLKYSNELESSKYQATPRPDPPNGPASKGQHQWPSRRKPPSQIFLMFPMGTPTIRALAPQRPQPVVAFGGA